MRMEVVQELSGRVMKISVEEETDDFGREMLGYQSVRGILGAQLQWVNCAPQYLYEIGNRISLSELFQKEYLTTEKFRRIIRQLVDIFERAEEYFLNERNMLLLTDYMFYDEKREELYVAYLDGYDEDVAQGISKMLEQFMNTMNHRDKELVFLVYGLHKISREKNFCLGQLTERVGEWKPERENVGEKRKAGQRQIEQRKEEGSSRPDFTARKSADDHRMMKSLQSEKQNKKQIAVYTFPAVFVGIATVIVLLAYQGGYLQETATGELSMKKIAILFVIFILSGWCVLNHIRGREENEKESGRIIHDEDDATEVLAGEGLDETVVLERRAGQNQHVNLIPDDWQREEIHIRKSPVFIGKDTAKTEIHIKEGEISRVHAKIVLEDGEVYIIDQESTNGTFINGERLLPWERRQLKNEDKIAFSSIYYRVEMNS